MDAPLETTTGPQEPQIVWHWNPLSALADDREKGRAAVQLLFDMAVKQKIIPEFKGDIFLN